MDNTLLDTVRNSLGRPTKAQVEKEDLLAKLESIHMHLAEGRRKAETEWWINDQFYNNNHVMYNITTRRIQAVADKTGDRVVVNKIAQIGRAVTAYLNKEHPTASILPGVQDDDAYNRAKKEKHFVDYLYDDQQMNRKTKQVTLDGYKYKVGWFKVIWDNTAFSPTTPFEYEGTKGNTTPGKVVIDRVDPFELYWDPVAKEKGDMRWIEHVMARPIGEIKANKLYKDTAGLRGDKKLASSNLKSTQIRTQTGTAGNFETNADDDLATILLHETYMRTWVDGESKVRVVTWTTGRIHYDRIWPVDEFPFEFYQTDIAGSLLDGGGAIRNLRDINRSLNQLVTQVQENARIMGKINWRIPRGSNVNVITDETGQYIEHDPSPGGAPHQITPSPLPNYIMDQISRLEHYLDDIGGSHDASYGRSPGSRASGSLVNQLQEGDSNNLSMMRDNLDDCLSRVYRLALKTFKACAKTDMAVRSETDALGLNTWMKLKPSEVSFDDSVVIRTGTNMPYSLSQKQELVMTMWKEKLLQDPKQVLKLLEFNDIETVVGTDQLDIERATRENQDLYNGKPVHEPLRNEDHDVHIRIHTQLMKSELFYAAPIEVQDAITEHWQKHVSVSIELRKLSASMNYEPIKRNLTLQVRPNSFSEITPIERTNFLGDFGVQSDAGEIQARGGTSVQDPAEAERQAQQEDMQMMEAKPVQISIADNHQVHIETHSQVMESAAFEQLPDVIKELFVSHVKQHVEALKAQSAMPGLVANPASQNPVHPQIIQPIGKTKPVNKAAQDPSTAIQRPLAPQEMLQHKEAVKHQLASESLAHKQAQAKAKAKSSSKKPRK